MPTVVADVARYQPLTPVIEAMRGLWMGHTSTGVGVGVETALALGCCAAIVAVSAPVAAWLFRTRASA